MKSWPLGIVACIFFAVHAGYHVARGNPENAVWMCHLATLGIGAALIGRWPVLNAIGVLWLAAGVPLWAIYLATGGEFFPTSVLPHLGGLAVGVIGLTRLGVPAGVWMAALSALIVLILVCRVATPERADVNLAFTMWPAREAISLAHAGTVAAAFALLAALFLGLERGLLRVRVLAPRKAI
jgi:hypothetical protein